MVVGSALLVLQLIAGWYLPEPPPSCPDRPEIMEGATIRIRSEHKWPEKIILDTDQPTFSPLPIEVAPNQQLVDPLPNEMMDQRSADAPAGPNRDLQPIVAHRAPARAKRKKRKPPSTQVARIRNRNERPLGTSQECCRFEWESTPATSKTSLRRRVTRRDSWIGWHLP
jgi:hypothetical protein